MSAFVDVKALRGIVRREDMLAVSAAEAERALAAGAETRDRVVHELAGLPGYCPAVRDAVRRDLAELRAHEVLGELWLVRQYATAMVGSVADGIDPAQLAEVARDLRHVADTIAADQWPHVGAAVQLGNDARSARAELAKVTS